MSPLFFQTLRLQWSLFVENYIAINPGSNILRVEGKAESRKIATALR